MDVDEFDRFYAGSFHRIAGQISVMIGDRDEAQDCVQEAFVRAWSHRRKLDGAKSPEAWVRTTAYRLAVSRWRRVALSRRNPDRALQPITPEPEPNVEHKALVEALRQLPDTQRQAIVLHHLCDLSVADIACEVGVPVGTIKARLSRGRSALLALLREDTTGLAEGARHV